MYMNTIKKPIANLLKEYYIVIPKDRYKINWVDLSVATYRNHRFPNQLNYFQVTE